MGLHSGVTAMYDKDNILFSFKEYIDVGRMYIEQKDVYNNITMVRWEAQVDTALCLPSLDVIFIIAKAM